VPLGPLLLFGNQQSLNTGASVVTLYCFNPSQSNAGLLTTTQPTASTSTTGWTVGTTSVGNYSRQTYNTEKAAATFGTTVQPSDSPLGSAEDCWRYGPLTGTFSLGTWYSSASVIAVTSGGNQDGRVRVRLWRSHNADGTVATEITASAGVMVGSRTTNITTTVAQSSAASAQIAAFSVNGEYLFMQCAWEVL
jgi:hypothetical protein